MRRTRRTKPAASPRVAKPKRQWGSDTRTALPVVPPPAQESTLLIGQLAIAVTVIGWALFVILTLTRTSLGGASDRPPLDLRRSATSRS
ncbi:MAG TPA: hypothetical protein VGO48_16000 [Conexibacter sp.]|nr:hypothetical protein [Conexibacter sp.]